MQTTTTPVPDVPLPAGAEWADDWQDVQSTPWRVIKSADRHIDGCEVSVFATAVQWTDGTLDQSGGDAPHVTVGGFDYYDGVTADQARAVAAAILEAADELDKWTSR